MGSERRIECRKIAKTAIQRDVQDRASCVCEQARGAKKSLLQYVVIRRCADDRLEQPCVVKPAEPGAACKFIQRQSFAKAGVCMT